MTRVNRIGILGGLVLAFGVMAVLIMAQPLATEASGHGRDRVGPAITWPAGVSDDRDEHMQVYSYVNALPAGFPTTMTGEWVIGAVTYTAGITTHLDQDDGAFAVGQCVGVEYLSTTNRLALEIETVPAFKCTFGGRIPSAVIRGVVTSFPPGLVGPWTISATVYTATEATRFEQEHGPFFVGGCARVRFDPANNIAFEISTEEAGKCGGPELAEQKFYGVISEIPTGTFGVWGIGGQSFVVTGTTELEHEHGPLAIGACAEVEYVKSGSDHLAKEIGTEEMFKCSNGTSTNVAIGRISSFPPELFGAWVITRNGGFTDTFQVSVSTELDQEHGSFAVGACIKVKYYSQTGINYAVEIETEEAKYCGGAVPPLPGMNLVFARVNQFPSAAPPVGLWVIGGAEYSATQATKFGQEHGPFAVDACVKALYQVVSGTNILHQVQTKDDHKCAIDGADVFRSFGVVESFPDGWIGQWQIGGISYTANISTELEQEHGFFAVGAFVEVKYTVSGAERIALSIETHVAPNHGMVNVFGVLQAHDSSDDWSSWRVNGVTYQSDLAIQVDTSGRAPVIGEPVVLNTYRDSNGVAFVTSARQPYRAFMPIVFQGP